jgi:hypothetical protein
MGTTVDKLAKLAATKEAIRIAINDKGVTVSETEPFSSYPEKIASIESGGGTSLINISLTLDGATNTITKGATITITDNATGEEIVKTWEGSMIQVAIPSLEEYTIKCSKITGYSSPKKVVFTPSKNVTYDYTFNYITPPVGVYLLTTDDELIAPADWNSSYDCVGVYVGRSSNIPNNKHSKVVLYPSFESCKAINITSDNYNDLVLGYVNGNYNDQSNVDHKGLEITRYFYENYTGSSYTSFAHRKAWKYTFKNGAQGWIPTWDDLKYFVILNWAAIKQCYETIGVTIPTSVNPTMSYEWTDYGDGDVYRASSLWSCKAGSFYSEYGVSDDEYYAWQTIEYPYNYGGGVNGSSSNMYLLSFSLY